MVLVQEVSLTLLINSTHLKLPSQNHQQLIGKENKANLLISSKVQENTLLNKKIDLCMTLMYNSLKNIVSVDGTNGNLSEDLHAHGTMLSEYRSILINKPILTNRETGHLHLGYMNLHQDTSLYHPMQIIQQLEEIETTINMFPNQTHYPYGIIFTWAITEN